MIYMGSKSLKVLNKEGDSGKLDYWMVESALMVKGLTIDIYNKQFICFIWAEVHIHEVINKMLLCHFCCECKKYCWAVK